MADGYHRVELDHCLDIDEVARRMMMYASEGQMIDFKPDKAKDTDGQVDEEGARYSPHSWKGKVKLPRTVSGRSNRKEVTIGITDYEYFDI